MSGAGILGVIVAYQVALIAIGLWARRRTRDHTDYFIGGRNLGGFVASLSYAAGSSSAWSILGVSGIAYAQGVSAVWLLPGTLTGHVIAWFLIARRLRDASRAHGWVTLTDVVCRDLTGGARRFATAFAGIAVVISFVFYVAAQFQGAGNTFGETFGLPVSTSVAIGAAVILVYTLIGGFWAVSVTDALQAVVMLVGAVMLCVAAVSACGGFGPLFAALPPEHLAPLGANVGWLAVGFFIGMVSIGFGPLGQPHLLNRMMALRDEAALRRGRVVALAWFVIVLSSMFLTGLAGHALATEVVDGERLFFHLTSALLPAMVAGITIAAVLSAVMSTADSQLLVAASVISHDLGLGRERVSVSRWIITAMVVVAVVISVWLPEAIFSRVLFAWNALGATFGPLVLFTVFRWRHAPWAAPAAMVVGFLGTVVFYVLPDTPGDFAERFLPFVVGVGLLAVSRGWSSSVSAGMEPSRSRPSRHGL